MTHSALTPIAHHDAQVVIIGAGPAGLMAAETIARAGISVDIYEAMPSVARKLLIAGVGGLNLTHSQPRPQFDQYYGDAAQRVSSWLDDCDSESIRDWAQSLHIDTFVGSSGRVFPTDMKAAPLLRSWMRRLRKLGVRVHLRHRWLGVSDEGALILQSPAETFERPARCTVFAMGGGSWSRLGADGTWVARFADLAIPVTPLSASNCGFDCDWSPIFRQRFAGAAVKPVAASAKPQPPESFLRGEFVVTEHGLEGSLIYALGAELRAQLLASGQATLYLDLTPGRTQQRLATDIAAARGKRSVSEHLRRRTGIDGVRLGLLREAVGPSLDLDAEALAEKIKCLPMTLLRTRPIDEAISTAGGVKLTTLDEQLMLRTRPGWFCAGEMLDWDAPTGGFLLTACFASGRVAGQGVIRWLQNF